MGKEDRKLIVAVVFILLCLVVLAILLTPPEVTDQFKRTIEPKDYSPQRR